MNSPRVAICIVNYQGWRDTLECLASIDRLTYPELRVVLVENGSPNQSRIRLTAFFKKNGFSLKNNYPGRAATETTPARPKGLRSAAAVRGWKNIDRLDFLTVRENRGFAGGNNLALAWLNQIAPPFDYYLFLNNDTVVEPDFLGRLVRTIERPPAGMADLRGRLHQRARLGIIGPKILNYYARDRTCFAGGRLTRFFTRGLHIKESSLGKERSFKKAFLVDYCTGCALMIKRETLEAIGPMSEDYFMYYEDTDWCLRARRQGWQVGLEPRAIIYHKVSRSAQPESPFYIYYMVRNGLMLARRHAPPLKKIAAYLLSGLIFLKQPLKLIYAPRRRQWAPAIMKAVIDFWRGTTGRTVEPGLKAVTLIKRHGEPDKKTSG